MAEIFSNHIGNSSELLVLADIKPGFVPVRTPITYAARLRRHLKLVDALRRAGLETDGSGNYVGPIDTLRSLQFITWTLIDNDTRMLLSVSFDQPFEPYIRRIVDVSGGLLDSVFCHCQGFDGHSSDQGFHKFMDFIEANQAPVELFAAAAPNLSVDDADFLRETDDALRSGAWPDDDVASHMAKHKLTSPPEKLIQAAMRHPDQMLHQSFRILRALYSSAPFFPARQAPAGETSDDVIYANLVRTLMPGLWPLLIRRTPDLTDAERGALLAGFDPSDPKPAYDAVVGASNAEKDPLLDLMIKSYAEPLAWVGHKPRGTAEKIRSEPRAPGKVQAGLLDSPGTLNHGAMMLLRVDDPAAGRAFLSKMESRLWPEKSDLVWNLSLTLNGLRAMDMHESRIARFPRAFREGMERRAGLLGDTDVNHPQNWVWPKGNWPLGGNLRRIAPGSVDIIVQASCLAPLTEQSYRFSADHPLHDAVAALDADLPDGVTLTAVEVMQSRFDPETPGRAIGQLGFEDGISQPQLDGSHEYDAAEEMPHLPPRPEKAEIGDVLIGHRSKLDPEGLFQPQDAPLRDGSFQVIRKLRIDAAGFHAAAKSAETPELPAKVIAAKMMGRHQDGTPFAPGAKDESNFNHMGDPEGLHTPLQSHVRRTNPREVKTPRILRRGFSYGPYLDGDGADPEADRGLMFICYNAALAEQFEIVQRWVSGGNSTGIASDHGDPILAPKRAGAKKVYSFPHEKGGKTEAITISLPDRPFGVLQWGAYAFTPSLEGLRTLADDKITQSIAPDGAPSALPDSKEDWQRVLEDTDEVRREERRAVRAAIAAEGGAVKTDYGVVVASAEALDAVMSNAGGAFAAQPYLARMEETVGPQFLGFDETPEHVAKGYDHARDAGAVWEFMNERLDPQAVFDHAYALTRAHVDALPDEVVPTSGGAIDGPSMGRMVSMHRLINNVSAALCRDLFGLDGADMQFGGPEVPMAPKVHCPGDFLNTAAYIFGPHPSPMLGGYAKMRGAMVQQALNGLVAQGTAPEGTLLAHLRDLASCDAYWTDAKIASVLSSVTTGLVAPVMGSFMMVMADWIGTGTLWRHQQRMQEAAAPDTAATRAFGEAVLQPAVIAALIRRTAPDLIQRTATKDTTLGGCPVAKGDHVIASLGAAAHERPGEALHYLFGGTYGTEDGASVHACPGRTAGLMTLLGCTTGLMSYDTLKAAGPVALRII